MAVILTKLPDNLTAALKRVADGGERIVLQRCGKRVAALVPLEDLEALERWENEQDIKAAKKALKEKDSIPLAEVIRRLGSKWRRRDSLWTSSRPRR